MAGIPPGELLSYAAMDGKSHAELQPGAPTAVQKAAGMIVRLMAICLLLLGLCMALLAAGQLVFAHLGDRVRFVNVIVAFSLTAVVIVVAEFADAFARYLRGRLRVRTGTGFGLWVGLMASRTLVVFCCVGLLMGSVWSGLRGHPGWLGLGALAAVVIVATQLAFQRLRGRGNGIHWFEGRG